MESALVQACQHSFPSAVYLLCFNHVRRNIKDKLQELSIPEDVRSVIIPDIIWRAGRELSFEGLVDAKCDAELVKGVVKSGKIYPICAFTLENT